MLPFLRPQPTAAQLAFQRAEYLLRDLFDVDRVSESDWRFWRGETSPCLLTMWGFRGSDRETPRRKGPYDGVIWDIAWVVKRKLTEGQLMTVRAAAGRGVVELDETPLIGPPELLFFDRMITPTDFEDVEARFFLDECFMAVSRIQKVLSHE